MPESTSYPNALPIQTWYPLYQQTGQQTSKLVGIWSQSVQMRATQTGLTYCSTRPVEINQSRQVISDVNASCRRDKISLGKLGWKNTLRVLTLFLRGWDGLIFEMCSEMEQRPRRAYQRISLLSQHLSILMLLQNIRMTGVQISPIN